MPVDVRAVRAAIVEHVDGFFPRHRKELVRLPGLDGWPDLRVIRMDLPDNPVEPFACLTLGTWELTKGRSEGLELMLLAPDRAPVHLETLAAAVRAHAADPLTVGSIVALGRGWVEGSACDHLLVTLPYPYGAPLEHVRAPGVAVRVLWLVPITAAEAKLRHEQGLEALERQLQDAHVDFLQR